jgi:hypothetical protein
MTTAENHHCFCDHCVQIRRLEAQVEELEVQVKNTRNSALLEAKIAAFHAGNEAAKDTDRGYVVYRTRDKIMKAILELQEGPKP